MGLKCFASALQVLLFDVGFFFLFVMIHFVFRLLACMFDTLFSSYKEKNVVNMDKYVPMLLNLFAQILVEEHSQQLRSAAVHCVSVYVFALCLSLCFLHIPVHSCALVCIELHCFRFCCVCVFFF